MSLLDGVVRGIVDAHLHQWNPRSTPWAANRLSRLYRFVPAFGDRVFPMVVSQADREYVLTPSTVARVYEPMQYLADTSPVFKTAGVRVDTVVHMESHWRGDETAGRVDTPAGRSAVEETRYVTTLPFGADSLPQLGAIVAHADPRAERFAELIDEHAALTDRLRGIRWITTRHPDPKIRNGADADGILSSPSFLKGFAEVADRRLVFDAFVYSHQLYDVVTLAREYPEVTIVVDHVGAPVGVFGPVGARTGATAGARADIMRLWRERMVTLAAYPNVMVKLSGLGLPVLGYGRERWGNVGSRATLTEMVGPLVDHVFTHFGADRVMFGSNFPIDKPNVSFDMIVGALVDLIAPLGGDYALSKVFRDNALRVYKIETPG
ncbi:MULTISPECIES: amidohydrolase family protein [Gordonia]|uniref:Amidohydrolase family protein n=1 Tax=Gordonia tangerina TaxID=2911060 RepID=A0ABS9DE51_9ACTN|nr:amidohydrolase family protein [Gordonia tangerina]MCF3937367.1 amidohydrolase family protein [Gordonia tangerina]